MLFTIASTGAYISALSKVTDLSVNSCFKVDSSCSYLVSSDCDSCRYLFLLFIISPSSSATCLLSLISSVAPISPFSTRGKFRFNSSLANFKALCNTLISSFKASCFLLNNSFWELTNSGYSKDSGVKTKSFLNTSAFNLEIWASVAAMFALIASTSALNSDSSSLAITSPFFTNWPSFTYISFTTPSFADWIACFLDTAITCPFALEICSNFAK